MNIHAFAAANNVAAFFCTVFLTVEFYKMSGSLHSLWLLLFVFSIKVSPSIETITYKDDEKENK